MRAQTFLWLVYHYLEDSSANPFDDSWSRNNPGKCPYIYQVDHISLASENADTLSELTWAQKMAARRATFLDKQMDIELRSKELMPGKESYEPRNLQVRENVSTCGYRCIAITVAITINIQPGDTRAVHNNVNLKPSSPDHPVESHQGERS